MGRTALATAWLATVALLLSCVLPSFILSQYQAAGFNGSFELMGSGYPVNWSFSESPVREGDMVVSLDRDLVCDGGKSLKAEVVTAHEGAQVFYQVWAKPALSGRTIVEPGNSYRISFWVRNQGAKVHGRWVTTSSDHQRHFRHEDMVQLDETSEGWLQLEDLVRVGEGEHLLELIFVATRAGVFWCGDVRVEEMI